MTQLPFNQTSLSIVYQILKQIRTTMENKKQLSPEQQKELISTLKARFEKNRNRHEGMEWAQVETRLNDEKMGEKLWSLNEMERTGGEPDVDWF